MFKESDLLILNHIRKNSRQSLADISRKTRMPISTIFDKLKKLESTVIKRHVSLLNFSELSHNIMVNFSIKTKDNEKAKVFLLNDKNVNSLYKVSPNFDFYAECIFRNMGELELFKDELARLNICFEDNFIVNEVKREIFQL